jgi:hypothetical protein
VRWIEGGVLGLTFALRGKIRRLQIPSVQSPRRADHLWEHTCFEAFVSVKNEFAYREYNFSPSGEWAVYYFRGYRDGTLLADDSFAPTIAVRSAEDSFELDAITHVEGPPSIGQGRPLRLGLSAVIEEKNQVLSYWALQHSTGEPDFHQPDGFALEIMPPGVDGADNRAYTEKP